MSDAKRRRSQPGPTGEFPRGKLHATDEGALNVRVGVRDKTVVIEFGKEIGWLGLDADSALALSVEIGRLALGLGGKYQP